MTALHVGWEWLVVCLASALWSGGSRLRLWRDSAVVGGVGGGAVWSGAGLAILVPWGPAGALLVPCGHPARVHLVWESEWSMWKGP